MKVKELSEILLCLNPEWDVEFCCSNVLGSELGWGIEYRTYNISGFDIGHSDEIIQLSGNLKD